MYKLKYSGKMKKDLKTCQKRNVDFSLLEQVLNKLMVPEHIPICSDKVGALDHLISNLWKGEYKARLYGYNLRIGLMGLVEAYERGCQNRYEIAEHLGVTEAYLEECVHCYRENTGAVPP